jgi:hypothetical protein
MGRAIWLNRDPIQEAGGIKLVIVVVIVGGLIWGSGGAAAPILAFEGKIKL